MECKICRKKIDCPDLADEPTVFYRRLPEAVYHYTFGVACLSHHGVREHYDALLVKAGPEERKHGN